MRYLLIPLLLIPLGSCTTSREDRDFAAYAKALQQACALPQQPSNLAPFCPNK